MYYNIFFKGVPKITHLYLRVRGIALFEVLKFFIWAFSRPNFTKSNFFAMLIFLTNQYKTAHVITFNILVVLPHVAGDCWV